MIHPGGKVEVPVDAAAGISQRYRDNLDQAELRLLFEGADADNSKFLEVEEATDLLTSEMIDCFACGNEKVLATVQECMEARMKGHDNTDRFRMNFNDFSELFDSVRSKLRVDDALYISVSGYQDIDMVKSQRGLESLLMPSQNGCFDQATTLIIDMSSKARGKAILRSNVSVIVNTYMDIKC